MQKRKLGTNGPELTVVGFGAWAIGGPWKMGWGPQDDNEAIDAIHAGLDHGINWIDTAHVYGFGHSEEVVGKAIKGRRDSVFVATKCGLIPDGEGGAKGHLKRESVREELEGSLRRLGVDVIDLYQIHWPNPDEDIEEAWTELANAADQGLVRYIGVSNFNVAQMERVARIRPITSLQPPYSMLRQAIRDEILPYCEANGIGVVNYSPMLSGMLTGAVSHERVRNMARDDWRLNNKEWKEPNLSANIEFVESVLRPIGEKYGVEPGQVAVAWTLADPRITSAIVGARRPAQIIKTVRAGEFSLTEEDLATIAKGIAEREEKIRASAAAVS